MWKWQTDKRREQDNNGIPELSLENKKKGVLRQKKAYLDMKDIVCLFKGYIFNQITDIL